MSYRYYANCQWNSNETWFLEGCRFVRASSTLSTYHIWGRTKVGEEVNRNFIIDQNTGGQGGKPARQHTVSALVNDQLYHRDQDVCSSQERMMLYCLYNAFIILFQFSERNIFLTLQYVQCIVPLTVVSTIVSNNYTLLFHFWTGLQ